MARQGLNLSLCLSADLLTAPHPSKDSVAPLGAPAVFENYCPSYMFSEIVF